MIHLPISNPCVVCIYILALLAHCSDTLRTVALLRSRHTWLITPKETWAMCGVCVLGELCSP